MEKLTKYDESGWATEAKVLLVETGIKMVGRYSEHFLDSVIKATVKLR